jgi:hypothetical protein
MQMATGHFLARLVYAAAKFGVADHLVDSPKSAVDIARATGCDPEAFHRLRRDDARQPAAADRAGPAATARVPVSAVRTWRCCF